MSESKGLMAGFSVTDLKDRIARAPYDELWARLKSRTREVMAATREGNFTTLSYGSLAWHSVTPMVREAAMIWLLESDADALRYVEQCIDIVDRMNRDAEIRRKTLSGKPPVNSHGEIALASDLCRDGLDDDHRKRLLALMREILIDYHQGSEPYIGYSGGGNIPYCQTVNAAFCALTWGEDCSHPSWRNTIDHAVEYTRCYLRYGCDTGGYGYEGTGYSHSVFHYVYLLAELLCRNGVIDLFGQEPALRRCVEATVTLSFPGGSFLVNMNDHGLLIPQSMSWLLYTAKRFNDPLHLGMWYAYEGPDHPIRPYGDVMPWFRQNYLPGPTPIDECMGMLQALLHWDAEAPFTPVTRSTAPTVNYSPGTEVVNFRTSWDDDAVYVNIPGAGRSHASQTHRHDDAGHFSIYAHGEYLAIDTGRYNVGQDQHSVMITDDKYRTPTLGWGMSNRPGRISAFETGNMLSYACVDAAFMKKCNWADRHFLFVPCTGDDCYIVVIDNINRNNEKGVYWWQMHANPECALKITGENTAMLEGKRARLDLTFVAPCKEDFPGNHHVLELKTDEAEWAWPYGRNESPPHEKTWLAITSVRRPRLLARLEGLNGQLMAVIVPRRLNDAPWDVKIVRQRRLMQVDITHGNVIDRVIAALDHKYIRTDCLNAFAEIALVRRSADGATAGTWIH